MGFEMVVRAVGVEGLAVTIKANAEAEQTTLVAGRAVRQIGFNVVEIAEGGLNVSIHSATCGS